MSLSDDFSMLGTQVHASLGRCRAYLESRLEVSKQGELVWLAQPDFGPPYLGTYGASCAAISLIATGSSPDDPLIRQLLEYLCDHQMPSGGWTIRNADPVGLTTACAFSLIAFGLCGLRSEKETTTVLRGVEWLVANAKANGWPFYEGGNEIGTTPTALAVRALNRVKSQLTPGASKTLQHGCSALDKAFQEEGFILRRDDPPKGSVPVTSLALVTLRECDYPQYADPIRRAIEWLKQQNDLAHDNSDSFYAHSGGQHSGHVNYVHFTPALMLQALLDCEVDMIREPVVKQLVENLVTTQTRAGDWRSPLAPKETPTWMEMDAALALSRFSRYLAVIGPTLHFRDEVLRLDGQLISVTSQSSATSQSIVARLETLEHVVSRQQKILSVLSPTLNVVRTILPFSPLVVIFVLYIYLRVLVPNPYRLVDIVAVAMSFLSLILGLKSVLDSRRTARELDKQIGSSLPNKSQEVLASSLPVSADQKGAS